MCDPGKKAEIEIIKFCKGTGEITCGMSVRMQKYELVIFLWY